MNYKRLATRFARRNGVPVGLFLAQINQESGWNPNAVSPAGAIGIAQIVPKYHPSVDPHDPVASLKYAAHLMASLHAKYGSWRDALSAYNSGRPWSEGKGISETRNYVQSILGHAGNVPKGGFKLPGDFSPAELGMSEGPDVKQVALDSLGAIASGQTVQPTDQLASLVSSLGPEAEAMSTGGTTMPARRPARGRGLARTVLNQASRQIGQPYVWGGESRKEGGFDCSGLIQWAYAQAGVKIPRTTFDQKNVGRKVRWGHFRPGDLIFANGFHHVVMYVGNGRVIAAPHTGAVVRYQSVNDFRSSFSGARRIL